MSILKKLVLQKAVAITSMFEGGNGYSNIIGNFDGQGLSFGFLQWNFKQGTLQPLFMRLFNEHPEVAQRLLPEGGQYLKQAIEESNEMHWSSCIQSGNQVQEPWYTALYNLGQTTEFQQIEDDAAAYYINKAIDMCNEFNLKTDRAFCLMFDIAVQMGGLEYYDMVETEYIDRLKSIATVASLKANPQWRKDVYNRKMAIVLGQDMGRGWDSSIKFTDTSAFGEDLVNVGDYDIGNIQRLLDVIGYSINISGNADDATIDAIKDFKGKNGLQVNEYLDNWTYDAIVKASFEPSLDLLVSRGKITSKQYWLDNCVDGKTVKGEWAGVVIRKYAADYVILSGTPDAVNYCVEQGIISSPDYWIANAVEGKECDGKYCRVLIINIAKKLVC